MVKHKQRFVVTVNTAATRQAPPIGKCSRWK